MAFRETGCKCPLNPSEIPPGHSQADIHAVGMERLEAAQALPRSEDAFVFEEGHEKVLVIAGQRDDGGWPFATRKSFDHLHGAKTTVDVVAQENRRNLVERLTLHISFDSLGHLLEQVVTTMNVAHAIHPNPIRDSTRNRVQRRRLCKDLA